MKDLLQKIASLHNLNMLSFNSLFGGDINEVYLLDCSSEKVVVKLNSASKYPGMFEAEKKGLELLAQTNTLRIPQIIGCGDYNGYSYLMLEYITSGHKNPDFWEVFGRDLARLHKNSNETFGLDHNNYIGSLPQKNTTHSNAADFYISERLEPQFKMARDNGRLSFNTSEFYKAVSEIIPDEPPALVHGDLWNGNYMVDEKGKPVLIDPAVAYAPREMDLGMMQLFGGFPEILFVNYNDDFPLESGWRERTSLWQLYYLLVHLNLFGSGYLGQVKSAIAKYS